MKNILLCLLISLSFGVSSAQQSDEQEARIQRDKIEIILRIKDRRTEHDGKLISFLSDKNPVVRRSAAFAFGSIQDTSVLGLLTTCLTDPDPSVQNAGAFAIGQTGTVLSKPGRQQLEYDLIWKRLNQTGAAARLIEEIGKFGTETGLGDLLVRIGNSFPPQHAEAMTMCIARYGIRGITSVDAVRYLIRFTRPADATPWRVAYALQRIGDHPEIRQELEHLLELGKHQDPLVRMNLAALLGKIKEGRGAIDALAKLAEFDSDWRVRVNALKALANFDLRGRNNEIEIFRRAFFDYNQHVSFTALSAFANTGLTPVDANTTTQETFTQLRYIAKNESDDFSWQAQAEASLSLAKLAGKAALSVIRPTSRPYQYLQGRLLVALGTTGAPEVAQTLASYTDNKDPLIARSALEGLQYLVEHNPRNAGIIETTYNACIASLSRKDVAVTGTAAAILGDTLFRRQSSVAPLLETLVSLRVPNDIEIMQEIISTLGKLGDTRAILPLTDLLAQSDRSIVVAAASALHEITGQDYSSRTQRSFEPLLTDFDFGYLRALPETVRVNIETTRGSIIVGLYSGVAPFTVMSFLKLAAQRGYYRGLKFHRVVPNFVIQGGDPRGDGWGGPGYSIRSEFSDLTYDTGVLGMASAGKDTEGSQFFITHSPQPHLDGRYTIFGKVLSGMDVVDRIQIDDRIFDVSVVETDPGR